MEHHLKKKKKILDTQVIEGKQACQLFRYLGFRERLCRTSVARGKLSARRARDAYAVTEKSKLDQPPSGSEPVRSTKEERVYAVHRNPRHITHRLLSVRFIGQT